MKKEKVKYGLLCTVSVVVFVLLAIYASANKSEDVDMIMPSVYFLEGMICWHVLLLGLVAEAVVVKCFLKENYLKTATITLVMNAISVVLGFVTLFIAGLLVEVVLLPFPVGTFHISHWIVSFLFIILTNASIEGLVVKIGFKYKFKSTFLWLCLANAISIIICFLLHLSWTEAIFF